MTERQEKGTDEEIGAGRGELSGAMKQGNDPQIKLLTTNPQKNQNESVYLRASSSKQWAAISGRTGIDPDTDPDPEIPAVQSHFLRFRQISVTDAED